MCMYMYIEIQQGDDIDTNKSYSGKVSFFQRIMIFRACGMHVNFFAGADLIHTLFEISMVVSRSDLHLPGSGKVYGAPRRTRGSHP